MFSTLETIFYQKNILMFLSIWPIIYYIIHVFSKEFFFCLYYQAFFVWFTFSQRKRFCLFYQAFFAWFIFFQRKCFCLFDQAFIAWFTFFSKEMFLVTWSIWMIHLDSMDDYMFFSNDISFEFYDHMLLFMISSLSFFWLYNFGHGNSFEFFLKYIFFSHDIWFE